MPKSKDQLARVPSTLCGHSPPHVPSASKIKVSDLEAILTDWFELPVVLTSSGRSALLLCLTNFGLNRYRDRVAVPRITSACVLDAVIRRAFPIDAAERDDAGVTIFYPQFGVPQKEQDIHGRIVEDDCHAFFATSTSGARRWLGEAAAFSLSKFFSMNTMVGGLVVHNRTEAERLREQRDRHPHRNPRERSRIAAELSTFHPDGSPSLQAIYLDKLINPNVCDDDLGGAPTSLSAISEIGGKRRKILDRYLRSLPRNFQPLDWSEVLQNCLPYVFPLVGDPEQLARIDARLSDIGIRAGVYQMDVARRMTAPALVPAVMVPCHEFVPDTVQEEVCRILSAAR
jgi:hypothetical protein